MRFSHLVVLFFLAIAANGQIYAPGIRNFGQKDFGKNQAPNNYCIAQDKRGVIYSGNAGGVLEYDGKSWRLIPVKTGEYVNSISIAENGIIYVSTIGEFGFIAPDTKGNLGFHSLNHLLPKEEIPGDILRCHALKDGVYFQSETKIYYYSNGTITVLLPEDSFHLSFSCEDEFYVRDRHTGLVKYSNGKRSLVSADTLFREYGIFGILPADDELMIITLEKGLWYLNKKSGVLRPNEFNKEYSFVQFYGGIRLSDSHYALNTLDRGIIVMDKTGWPVHQINKKSGLPTDEIQQVIEYRQGNIWCATGVGVSFIESSSPFQYLTSRHGLEGEVESVSIINGKIIAGTSAGLFESTEDENSFFRKKSEVKGHVYEVRSCRISEEKQFLLISSSDGLYIAENDEYKKISEGNFNSSSFIEEKNSIVAAGREGVYFFNFPSLALFHHAEVSITRVLRIESIRDAYDTAVINIWIGTSSQGVIRLKYLPDGKIAFDSYNNMDGLNQGFVRPFALGNEKKTKLIFATTSGFQEFVPEEEIRKSLDDSLKGRPEFERGFF